MLHQTLTNAVHEASKRDKLVSRLIYSKCTFVHLICWLKNGPHQSFKIILVFLLMLITAVNLPKSALVSMEVSMPSPDLDLLLQVLASIFCINQLTLLSTVSTCLTLLAWVTVSSVNIFSAKGQRFN